MFLALGFSRFDGESTLPPTAANADRWVAVLRGLDPKKINQDVYSFQKIQDLAIFYTGSQFEIYKKRVSPAVSVDKLLPKRLALLLLP